MNNKKVLTIIDTFGFLFRSYYVMQHLKSSSGFPTGMLTGFMNFVSSIGKDFYTDYLIFALDSSGDSFRNEIYPQYKAHRPEAPEDLKKQIPVVIEFINKMGFCSFSKDKFEADDIIASLATNAINHNLSVRIVSHDKDLYQLIDDNIVLFDPIKKTQITSKQCYDKYNIYPRQFVDYQALLGDSADNVPGVKGIGAKTATALINSYDNLDNIYNNLDNIQKPRWKKLLQDGKELAYISKQLVTLSKDCITIDKLGGLDKLTLPSQNPVLTIEPLLLKYDLNSIIKKVHKDGLGYKTTMPKGYQNKTETKKQENLECQYILLDDAEKLFKTINQISKDDIVAFDTETTSLDTSEANIVGFSFCFEPNKAYYVPIGHFYLGVGQQISHDIAKKAIQQLNNFKLILHNFKYDYAVIKYNFDIELNLFADTMILAWLEDSNKPVGMDKLALRLLDNYKTISFKDIVKKNENFSNVNIEQACKYAAQDAFVTKKLYEKLEDIFISNQEQYMLTLAKHYEYPFITLLYRMENRGIKVDIDFFQKLQEYNNQYLSKITQQIYDLANTQFNINSTKQLSQILFEELKLPIIKKTKTSYSTNEEVLIKLKDKHPIIPKLLEYREAFKLQSTYIEPLIQLASKNKEHKIYTSFLQTGTATGRLSSKNPNLQNIPVRTEAGKLIREGFMATNGYKLVSIDYSQIELRLLAHYSKDKALCDAFNNQEDIHLQTAIKIFGEDEAKNKRQVAKSINFGLLYGMGARKLAQQLQITTKEAKKYIDSYFQSFPTVKDYLQSIVDDAMQCGYVKTLIGRKRRFDFQNASALMKSNYQREAVNTVFQGSAADIIKLAMLKIDKKYQNDSQCKMLLQVHDELIFEIEENSVDMITKELVLIMQNIYKLEIPLKVEVNIGKNWKELK
jgi:DNA polymerase-1